MVNNGGRESNLKPFKPGQRANPAGKNGTLPPDIRQERKKNQSGLIRAVTELFLLTDKEAKDKMRDPMASQLQKSIQGIIAKCRGGDVIAFRYLMEVMVGKIPEHDYDGFSEEDLRILNRVKEVVDEQRRNQESIDASTASSSGH